MEYLYDYLGFFARVATIVVAILMVLGFAFANAARRPPESTGSLEVKHLNRELEDIKHALETALASPAELKVLEKARKKQRKSEAKEKVKDKDKDKTQDATKTPTTVEANQTPAPAVVAEQSPKRVFVLDFEGDTAASTVEQLRREITGVLTIATEHDEIVVRLESGGGMVHAYGLGASQLDRIVEQGVPLTVTVDKVAASGGYMMAAVANKIIAAPFALVGSIGVVAQVPNVHRLLKKHDVDVELITAGKHKRTLTVLGENTAEGREKFSEQIEDIHELFQAHLLARREQLDMDKVATGEAWYGEQAIGLDLVDELITSDSYLVNRARTSDVYEVSWKVPRKPLERLLGQFGGRLNRLWQGIFTDGIARLGRLGSHKSG